MARPAYLWDYDLDEADFQALLHGQKTFGRLDRDWAAVRLLEYAPYREIVRRLGFPAIVEGWPRWRHRLRSEGRKRGFDFLVQWLPEHRPELLAASGKAPPLMKKTLARLGEGGSLVIPAEYQEALGVDTGDELVLVLEDRTLRVLTPAEGIRRAQALVRAYVPQEHRLADELIEERRRESRLE
jgi:bifunctional DNA-binding transcriptional regulator/antitoxin component of YhaV-PrlF toxin-antitoxin module